MHQPTINLLSKKRPGEHKVLWQSCSPINRVHLGAPPFLVIHGSHDSLLPSKDAKALADASNAPVTQ